MCFCFPVCYQCVRRTLQSSIFRFEYKIFGLNAMDERAPSKRNGCRNQMTHIIFVQFDIFMVVICTLELWICFDGFIPLGMAILVALIKNAADRPVLSSELFAYTCFITLPFPHLNPIQTKSIKQHIRAKMKVDKKILEFRSSSEWNEAQAHSERDIQHRNNKITMR